MINRQLPPEVIQSATHVVNGIADHQPPVLTYLGHPLGDPKNQAVLGVKLPSHTENVGWSLTVTGLDNRATELFNVILRPRQLRPTSR